MTATPPGRSLVALPLHLSLRERSPSAFRGGIGAHVRAIAIGRGIEV